LTEVAAGTMLFGSWDKVALETDIHRDDIALRWVNPDRALITDASGQMIHFLQDESQPVPIIQHILQEAPRVNAPEGLQGYQVTLPQPGATAITVDNAGVLLSELAFNGSMTLVAIEPHQGNGQDLWITTWWQVVDTLPLPEEKLYPPPPEIYGGPRLKVFTHLLHEGQYNTGDDGLWVDPYSLRKGDKLLQVHYFKVDQMDLALDLAIGLYDPMTGERWLQTSGSDQIIISLGQ
jgi:hypothetical protein